MLSAGVVIFRSVGETPHCLVLRAFRNWDFPKGVVEAGESPFAAAMREVSEETGMTQLQFPWGEEFVETPPYARGKIARYYVAVTESDKVYLPVNPLLGRPEHHEFRWINCREARELLPPRLQSVLTWACTKATALHTRPQF